MATDNACGGIRREPTQVRSPDPILGAATKPVELHPGLLPSVISRKTSGWEYYDSCISISLLLATS